MARAGQLKSSGERLSDRVAVGVLTQAFPRSLVDEVLEETGRVQQRNRLLPARLVV
ncbi:transposase domain-containing protein, partial [Streptomyces sp. NPDC002215]